MAPALSTQRRSADHLPRGAETERNVGFGVAAIAGSLLLLIGVPILLLVFVGNPLPTEAPSRDWLTATIDADLIIKVLAVLVWIVWVHFVVCFLSEWQALRKGRMPANVMLGGGSQMLARRLVAGVLLLTGGAGIAHGLAAAQTPDTTAGNAASAAVATIVQTGGDLTGAKAGASAAADVGATSATSSAVGGAQKHYEVVPPQGRHHDTLWDISERLLGDPLRYKEIYELNKDRMQPDGRRLTDADLIQPGWQLLLPGDAKGPGVRTAAASMSVSAPGTVIAQPGSETASATADAGSVGNQVSSDAQADQDQGSSVDLGDLLLGGGLILAGLVTALTAKRGLFGSPDDMEGALRLAANPVRSDLLDRSLRLLSQIRHGQGLPMPDLSVVYLSDEKVIAHVVGSPEAPTHPWQVSEDGQSWTVTATDLEGVEVDAPAPYPALVDIAETHGFDVLVDLEYASGLIALGGNVGVAREVVMSSVVDLATHAWSDSVAVTMVGFGDEVAEVAPERITVAKDLDAALGDIESSLGAASSLLQRLGVDGVLSGRATARHDVLKPQVLVLSGAPTSVQIQRINALAAGGRTAFAALCVGDAPGARWRFVVDEAGHIDLGVLGVNGVARRFTTDANKELRESLQALVKDAAERSAAVASATPATFASPDLGGRKRDERPQFDTAPVRVQLLGPVAATLASSGQGPSRAIITELVAMAALHPNGLHEAVIRSALWPRGVTDDVVESTLRDTEIWLGVDASGKPRFAEGEDGLWHLSSDVYIDWDELQASALPDGGSEAAAYVRGLALAQGEAFSGTPAGRYSWLAFLRSARDCRALVVTMATRAATLLGAGDPKRAEQALRDGLKLVPASEELWRELIRLHSDDQPAGPSGIVDEMYSSLPEHTFEAETEALVAHLVPAASGRLKKSS